MADVFTKEKRSQVMSRIRGSGNKDTEIALMQILKKRGVTGWRRHKTIKFAPDSRYLGSKSKSAPVLSKRKAVRPDFVFSLKRIAVFVDGCFWHGCSIHCKIPSTNRSFWVTKLNYNKRRDSYVARRLRKDGWAVLRVWEHSLKQPSRFISRLERVLD